MQVLAARGPSRVTDLARELGVHKSTASRLLTTLERRGLAERVDDGASFVLGNGVALMAAGAARPRSLSDVSRPILQDLCVSSGETVSVNVLTEDGEVLTVEQVLGSSGLAGYNWLGQRSPSIATAAGKVLLAQLPEDQLARVLPDELPRLTSHTLVRADVVAEFTTIRRLGFATCRDELELGLSAVAAPVFDSTGTVAAISISGPTARVFGDRHHELAAGVVSASEQLSARLGDHPSAERSA